MKIEFWYEFASTYSYPAAMRVEDAAREAGVTLVWRPFLLGPIFGAQGWNDSPFNIYPAKGKYMWRDMARLCDAAGLTLKEPVRFPQNGLKAARLALLGQDEAWGRHSRAASISRISRNRKTYRTKACSRRFSPRSRSMRRR